MKQASLASPNFSKYETHFRVKNWHNINASSACTNTGHLWQPRTSGDDKKLTTAAF